MCKLYPFEFNYYIYDAAPNCMVSMYGYGKDFSNVYDWFVNSTYLDLGNPNFERFINNRVSLKILSDENYKKELLQVAINFI